MILLAPLAGTIRDLADVPDPVFAERLLGDGVAIAPDLAEILVAHAPCDGDVVKEGQILVRLDDTVTRAERVTVEACNEKGEKFTLEADGLLAICIQHELDHLLGKVFVEYLSPLKQNRIKTKLKKRAKHDL